MLNKTIKELVEQPYRYLTILGDVHDKPLSQRFYHRAEFKSVAAVTLGAVFLRAVLNDTSGAVDTTFVMAGAMLGYGFARGWSKRDDQFSVMMYYNGNKVIDTKPQDDQFTEPADFTATLNKKDFLASHTNVGVQILFLCVATFGALGVLKANGQSPHDYNDLFGSALALGVFSERVAKNFSDTIRTNRILSGEYVILASPPAKQEKREQERITLTLPEAAPQAAFSPASP